LTYDNLNSVFINADIDYNNVTNKPVLATVATSGSYNDLSNTPTLGTASALDVGTNANQVVQLNASAQLPAVDGSLLTNLPSGGGGLVYTAVATGDSPVAGAVSKHYSVNTSGGAVNINLPTIGAGNEGNEIRVKLKTAGNNLTLTPDTNDTVEGGTAGTAYTLTLQNQAITLVSDGVSNWEII
jgi:hypothetical protein